MRYAIPENLIKPAKAPHELFMANLALFHLLAAPIGLTLLNLGTLSFFLPIALSSLVIGYSLYQYRVKRDQGLWFVAAHWRLALNRYKILGIGYLLTTLMVGTAWLFSLTLTAKTAQDILLTVVSRIGAMPMLITVIICFVLESGAIYQAGQGEIPDDLIKRLPPAPDDLEPLPNEPQASL